MNANDVVLTLALLSSALGLDTSFRIAAVSEPGYGVFVKANASLFDHYDSQGAGKLVCSSGICNLPAFIEENNLISYEIVSKPVNVSSFCSSEGERVLQTPSVIGKKSHVPTVSPHSFKLLTLQSRRVTLLRDWPDALIYFKCVDDGLWSDWAMAEMKPLRDGEFFLNDFAPDCLLAFTFKSSNGQYDPAAHGKLPDPYVTRFADVFILQENVFNYRPSPTIKSSKVVTHAVSSSVSGIPSRSIRVYLPRNFEKAKTYPPAVLFHDGQNVFAPGGPFGCWDADSTVDDLIKDGQLAEVVMIAVDNSDNRIQEYLPPSDAYKGQTGIADKYVQFLRRDVLPLVAKEYNVETASVTTVGSSMGGLLSAYMAIHGGLASSAIIMSPSLWISPNFRNMAASSSVWPSVLYMDLGTDEGDDMWPYFWPLYDSAILSNEFVFGKSLLTAVGCGDEHNEAAWAKRLPLALQFVHDSRYQ